MKLLSLLLIYAVCSAAQFPDSIKNEIAIRQTLMVESEQSQSGTLVGTVIDARTRKPIADAKIEILGANKFGTSSQDGQYKIQSIPDGFYQIQATAPGYVSEMQNNIRVKKGSEEQLFFVLRFNSEDPPDFVPVDKQPQPLPGNNPAPNYPELGRKFRMEGTIWVKLLVDEKGNVSKTEIFREDFSREDSIGMLTNVSATEAKRITDETYAVKGLFEESVKTAARQWKFTPASMKGENVKVWVSIPFKFRLDSPHQEKKGSKK